MIIDHRGVFSADLLFSLLILIIMISGSLFITSQRLDMVDNFGDITGARALAEKVSIALNQAYSGGNGTDILVTLPGDINKKDYLVLVNSSGVYVEIEGKKGKVHMIPKKNLKFKKST